MKIENLDEVESLAKKYRKVMAAKKQIEEITGKDGGLSESFVLIDEDTSLKIVLHDLKAEVYEAIEGVLNAQHDKIVARFREI